MAYRVFTTLVLLSLLSGCGTIVFPDSWKGRQIPSSITKHYVKKGETLYSIAYRYGVEYRTLASWNKIRKPYRIYIGQQLTLKPQIKHRVKKGETLYSIAFRFGVDYRTLAKTNGIKSPYRIFIGDEVTVIPQANTPVVAKRQTGGQTNRPPTKSTSRKKTATKKRLSKKSYKKAPQKSASYNSKRKVFWGWPARGKIVTTFSPKDHRKGIDIRGKVGNKIVAADAGDVVYSGNGLLGYGNLIIIRHNSSYLSAYGHNRILLVKEGTKVKKGQKIAEMGRTRKKGAVLHFEIRRNGKPVNPVRYLPRS